MQYFNVFFTIRIIAHLITWIAGLPLEIFISFISIFISFIRFMHFYSHYNFLIYSFSFILSTKFFVSPRILTVFECALFSRSYKVRIIAHRVTWCQNVGLPLEIFISLVINLFYVVLQAL